MSTANLGSIVSDQNGFISKLEYFLQNFKGIGFGLLSIILMVINMLAFKELRRFSSEAYSKQLFKLFKYIFSKFPLR